MVVFRTIVILILLCLFSSPTGAADALKLQPEGQHYEFSHLVEILEDPEQHLTLADVKALDGKGFINNPHDVISIGRSSSVFWFRFKIIPPDHSEASPGALGCKWFLEVGKQGIGALDLYVPVATDTGETIYRKTEFGKWRPSSPGHIPSRTSVTALPARWNGGEWFYLRVRSDISINFALRIHSAAGYITRLLPDLYGFGILFGILAGMILYNLAIYLFLRDLTYLLYVLYISSMFLYLAILYGHFELLVDPDPAVMHLYFFGASGSTWFFAGMFGRLFLNTKTYAPVCDKILLVIIFMSFVVAGTAFSGQTYLAHKINAFLGMTCPPMAIFSALRVWRKGFAPAKYFFGAWLILVTGIILYSMGGTLIPRTPVTIYTFAFGAGIEAILLSLALADRIRLLQKEKDELRRSERRFRKEAITDEMTGLFNRRYLLETLGREIRRAQTDQNPLSLLILDVDNFKQFNDTFGHPEGDKVLKALAEVLFQQVREKDSPCRYGGEEFVVVLPHTGRSAALGVAERIRESFAAHVFQPDADGTGSQNITVTVSIGLAELRVGENGQEFIRRADKALYSAKTQGKNRVVCD